MSEQLVLEGMPDPGEEAQKLADDLAQHLLDEVFQAYRPLRLGAGEYRLADDDELKALDADGDQALILCRESDGAFFEAQVGVVAARLLDAESRQAVAETMPWDCRWVLYAPCGCATGVTTGRMRGVPMAVSEDEAWRSLHDDWHSIAIRKVLGYRIGFMTFERYRAEVSLLAKCPHGPEPEDTDG